MAEVTIPFSTSNEFSNVFRRDKHLVFVPQAEDSFFFSIPVLDCGFAYVGEYFRLVFFLSETGDALGMYSLASLIGAAPGGGFFNQQEEFLRAIGLYDIQGVITADGLREALRDNAWKYFSVESTPEPEIVPRNLLIVERRTLTGRKLNTSHDEIRRSGFARTDCNSVRFLNKGTTTALVDRLPLAPGETYDVPALAPDVTLVTTFRVTFDDGSTGIKIKPVDTGGPISVGGAGGDIT